MKTIFFSLSLILLSLAGIAQKIEYKFGDGSDVTDSLNSVVKWYKKMYKQPDFKKLNLYAGIDYCNGYIRLYVSQFPKEKAGLKELVRTTNRFIRISKDMDLPVIFDTDILSVTVASDKMDHINMNVYYLQIEKNEQYIWRVSRMNPTF
jgi:hypothetical protein